MIYIADTNKKLYNKVCKLLSHEIIGFTSGDSVKGYLIINADTLPCLYPRGDFSVVLPNGSIDTLSDYYVQNADNIFSSVSAAVDFLRGERAFESSFFTEQRIKAELYLRHLGMSDELLGFRYIAYAAASVALLPQPQNHKSILPLLSAVFGKSPQSIERAMRYAVEVTWENGNIDAQQTLLGYSISPEKGKPVTSELIHSIAELLREQLKQTDYKD